MNHSKQIDFFFNHYLNLKKKLENNYLTEQHLHDLNNLFNKTTGGRLSHYNLPLVCSISIVTVKNNGKIGYLGIVRNTKPHIGEFAFPGGFVNEFETPKQAAIRELSEEIGLELNEEKDWTLFAEKVNSKNQILMFYIYKTPIEFTVIQQHFEKLNDKSEVLDIIFLNQESTLCFPFHNEILKELTQHPNKGENHG